MSLNFDITDYVRMNGGPHSFMDHLPNWDYVERNLFSSEPWVLYFNYSVDDSALREKFSKLVEPLQQMYDLFDAWQQSSPEDQERIEEGIRSLALPEKIGQFKSGFIPTRHCAEHVAEIMNIDDTVTDLESYVDAFFVHLPKGSVLLQNKGVSSPGYFVPFGWSPRTRMLFFAGPDYCTSKRKAKSVDGYQPQDIFEYRRVPKGRGLPTDVHESKANCGPSALAAYLNISCAEAIELAPLYREKGYISPNPMRDAFKKFGTPHVLKTLNARKKSPTEVMRSYGSKGLALVKFFDGEPETGYIANVNTHWVAIDGENIYDVNAPKHFGMGNWMGEDQWNKFILPMVFNGFPDTTDFFVKNVLVPKS